MAENAGRACRVVCASDALAERGKAVLWDVQVRGLEAQAFVLRYEGRPVAYVNRCAHQPAQMDWLPGEFLDADRRYIICSMHGALYEPGSGRCVAGPCRGAHLHALDVAESDGLICWFPSVDVRAAADAEDNRATASPPQAG